MMIILKLFTVFFQIGLFSIGGGLAMVPLIERFVVGNGWLTTLELADVFAISEMTPGPFAVNSATFVGTKIAGLGGAAAATLGVILPSFIIVVIVAKFFENFQNHYAVQGVLTGIRPAVTALILTAVFSIGKTAFFRVPFQQIVSGAASVLASVNFVAVAIAVVAFIIIRTVKIHPILMLCISAGLGILFFQVLGL